MNDETLCKALAHPLVVIESPYGKRPDGSAASWEQIQRNVDYGQKAMLDAFGRGEYPYGSHLIYPGALRDAKPEERRMGMEAGFAWGAKADLVAVYYDLGITPGMVEGINRALAAKQPVHFRSISVTSPDGPTEASLNLYRLIPGILFDPILIVSGKIEAKRIEIVEPAIDATRDYKAP